MAERTQTTHQAIIDFISRFEPQRPCNTLSDLSDGVVLWLIMQRINGLVEPHSTFNLEPGSLASVLANLKLIMQSLENFYGALKRPWKRQSIDLIEIAHHKSEEQIVSLFMMVLAAAIESDSKETFIEKILTLPQESQVAFVTVIKRALGEGRANDQLNGYSPKVEQSAEKRLLEKLEQLEMQNDRLHVSVKELQQERGLLSNKLAAALDTISNEQRQNERLNELLRENCHANDLKSKEVEKEKTDNYIQNLKNKLLEVSRVHEKELSKLREELELERSGFTRLHQLQEQVEYYQEKYEECKQILLKFEKVENERAKLAKQSDEKEQLVRKLKERITELTEKIYELEERDVYDKMELEKKNTRIEQLYREIELVRTRSELLIHNPLPLKSAKSLSEICPEINQGDVSHLKEQNQTLLADLEKGTKKIRSLERELERCKREADKAHGLEVQNKKLEEILLEHNQTRGEQNELLVGCLYEMRMKYRELNEQSRKDARQSLPMRSHNKQLPKRVLS